MSETRCPDCGEANDACVCGDPYADDDYDYEELS